MVESVHVFGVIAEASCFQAVVEVGHRFAAVLCVVFVQVDEESEFLAHRGLNPCGDRPSGVGRDAFCFPDVEYALGAELVHAHFRGGKHAVSAGAEEQG